jgi:hypothetical protein
MLGLTRSTFVKYRPERHVGPNGLVAAVLTFTGRRKLGLVQAETRTLTSLTVTNDGPAAVRLLVESEATKDSFGATVQAGATAELDNVLPLEQWWNGDRAALPGWDGINVYWNDPA